MFRGWAWVLAAGLAAVACDDSAGSGGGAGGSGGSGGGGGSTPPPLDASTGADTGHDAQTPNPDANPRLDAGVPDATIYFDLGPMIDAAPDMGPLPDVGPLDGPPCDPRLNARACAAGQFCVHIPGQLPHIGRCQQGDACTPGDAASCPDPARPYCHLKGGGTFCTAVGALGLGDDCIDDLGIPQPCADGLLCNNSVCQSRCLPAGGDPACPESFRCDDISPAIGVTAGLCQPPACNWFTSAGCEDGQKCHYAIRNDGQVVGSCGVSNGENALDAPCALFPGGGDNCATGLVCIGPPNGDRFCRQLCDTGGYQSPCVEGKRCNEALSYTRNGSQVRVHGLGICVTNQ